MFDQPALFSDLRDAPLYAGAYDASLEVRRSPLLGKDGVLLIGDREGPSVEHVALEAFDMAAAPPLEEL